MKKTLDFICIGTAKSGTTTLFELAKGHPQIFMPGEKEAPFFDEEKIYPRGLDWYLKTYFAKAPADRLWGTITPQYMLGKNSLDPQDIAKRIHKDLPDLKLIAILRNPVERAYSHYQMLFQRKHLTKNFDEAVEELLAKKDLDRFRHEAIGESNSFLFGSEYGRILSYFYDNFPKKNILVLFMDDLKGDPEKVMGKLYKFLGISQDYKSEHLGKEFRKGGSEARVKLLAPGTIYKVPYVKKVWKSYTPYALRKRVEYSINLWNTKAGTSKFSPQSPAYKRLVGFYAEDVRRLEKLTGRKTPWTEWQKAKD